MHQTQQFNSIPQQCLGQSTVPTTDSQVVEAHLEATYEKEEKPFRPQASENGILNLSSFFPHAVVAALQATPARASEWGSNNWWGGYNEWWSWNRHDDGQQWHNWNESWEELGLCMHIFFLENTSAQYIGGLGLKMISL